VRDGSEVLDCNRGTYFTAISGGRPSLSEAETKVKDVRFSCYDWTKAEQLRQPGGTKYYTSWRTRGPVEKVRGSSTGRRSIARLIRDLSCRRSAICISVQRVFGNQVIT